MVEQMPDKVEIGKRIFDLRKEKKLSQMKLAELVDMSKNSISNIELGKQLCGTDKLHRFAEALDTTIDYLMYGTEATNEVDLEEKQIEMELILILQRLPKVEKRKILAGIKAFVETD